MFLFCSPKVKSTSRLAKGIKRALLPDLRGSPRKDWQGLAQAERPAVQKPRAGTKTISGA
jgi:hypothetical protein